MLLYCSSEEHLSRLGLPQLSLPSSIHPNAAQFPLVLPQLGSATRFTSTRLSRLGLPQLSLPSSVHLNLVQFRLDSPQLGCFDSAYPARFTSTRLNFDSIHLNWAQRLGSATRFTSNSAVSSSIHLNSAQFRLDSPQLGCL